MKNKKAEIAMISLLIIVIFGIVAITVGFGVTVGQTTTTAISADTFTASNTSCKALTSDCIASLTSTKNSTNGVAITTGNWTLCSTTGDNKNNGLLLTGDAVTETNYNGLTINASYDQRSCNYINGMTGTIVNYIPVLMALVLLIAVAMFVK